VSALHYRTAYWVEEGVYDRLSSFSEFESRVNDVVEEWRELREQAIPAS